MAACAAALAATFKSDWVRAHARDLLSVLLASLVIWLDVIAMINGLTAEMALGLTFTYFCVGVVLGLAFDRLAVLLAYIAVETGFATAVVLVTPDPEADPAVFIGGFVLTGGALLIGTYARVRVRAELESQGRLMASAERLSGLGSWTHEIATGDRRWSAGMYRLVGLPVGAGPPPTVSAYARQEFRPMLEEQERQLLRGEETTLDHRFEIERADGERREVRSVVQFIPPQDGAPSRLVGAVLDVTDQGAYERGLERARAEAEGAATLKSAILANMSHEIRTPLTAMIGYADLLREEVPPDLLDLVDPIQSGGLRLLSTLHDVLDLARMDAETKSLTLEPLDVAALAASVGEARREAVRSKGLGFTLDVPGRPLLVVADRAALERVLDHLLTNALKFTPSGAIALSVEARGGAQIRVSDTGRGIDPAFMPALFEPFHQESTGTGRTHEGSGLGLAITHRLVTAMGGTIEAESELGRGTTFTIRLPPAPAGESAWISRGSAVNARSPEGAVQGQE